MAQKHPTKGIASTQLPAERLAQLDRLAAKNGMTRSQLMRNVIEKYLDESPVDLTAAESAALARRKREAAAMRRLGEIGKGLRALS